MTLPPLRTPGSPIRSPTEKPSLGRYVVLKNRADGRQVAYFQVPAARRPEGWPATIPLPTSAPRTGVLDRAEVAAIRRDARALYERLTSAGTAKEPRARPRTIETLLATWQNSPEWRSLRLATQVDYDFVSLRIQAWSLERKHPDPALMTQPAVLSFLSHFSDRPATKARTARVLALVMQQAVALGWRTDNPVRGIRVKVPKSTTSIWEQSDVDQYVAAARQRGLASIALVILLMWEIGQRLTDMRSFRAGAEYDPDRGVFAFHQSKTGAPVIIEVSEGLRTALAQLTEPGVMFRYEPTGKPYTADQLTHAFSLVRDDAVAAGGRSLLLRQLRHSCVVQLARAGCTVPEISSVTGHTLGSVNSILGTYLPRDSTVARNAQIKRGLLIDRADTHPESGPPIREVGCRTISGDDLASW